MYATRRLNPQVCDTGRAAALRLYPSRYISAAGSEDRAGCRCTRTLAWDLVAARLGLRQACIMMWRPVLMRACRREAPFTGSGSSRMLITGRPFCGCRSLAGRPSPGRSGRVSAAPRARARSFRQRRPGSRWPTSVSALGQWPPCGAGASSALTHWHGVGRRRCRRGSNYSRPTPTAPRDFSRRPRRGRNQARPRPD